MSDSPTVIRADWPAPEGIVAFTTTCAGGVSEGPYASFNLGERCGDQPAAVAHNRRLLQAELLLGQTPVWLKQVHGTHIVDLTENRDVEPEADGSMSDLRDYSCVVLTADCLPVLLLSADGAVGAAVHCGWRGLKAGVLHNAVEALPAPARNTLAWLGPAIGQKAFEVGPEVRDAFLDRNPEHGQAFEPGQGDRWHADLYLLARQVLARAGVQHIFGGGWCTYSDPRFYSYRRSGVCGRMATVLARVSP